MFPKGFMWGAASASYQIEGAYREDGKGESIWDHFSHESGRIKHNENGDVACDHYHRFREDIAMMKELGLKSYRFSISWPRVIPDGTGKVNEKGLKFYSDLVDEICAAGMEPMLTLFHWDYPYALYEKGGWKNDESPDWFAAYVKVIVDALSDRVGYFMIFNEPQLFIGGGHHIALHAPFEKNDQKDMMKICRNVFLAHGKALRIIREYAKRDVEAGMAPTGSVFVPENDSPEAVEKAREKTFSIDAKNYSFSNAWWADPIMLGRFPEGAEEIFGKDLPVFSNEEWSLISAPLDFYGFNVYSARSAYGPDDNLTGYDEYSYMGSPKNTLGWNITPKVLYYAPKFFYERYHKSIIVTENGMPNLDLVSLDGKVHDPQRIDFVNRYLLQLEKAIDEGVDVIGYQYWSIMDNFEWAEGYDPRFGLIYVDYRNENRIFKDSALWYKNVIKTNGASLHD
ncbi:MAG: beta-glucosidase [Lachnospiraceae bacterium]|nr:beta-glucosidase [Lachnospiraceae bacterium]